MYSGDLAVHYFDVVTVLTYGKLIIAIFFEKSWDIICYLCTRIQILYLGASFFYVIPEWGEYLEIVIAALHSSPHNTMVNEAEKSWTHKALLACQNCGTRTMHLLRVSVLKTTS